MRSSRRGAVTGESFAQVNNPDPFAAPVWRSPVYRTPEFVIWLVQLARLLARMVWFVICHPLLDLVAGLVLLDYFNLGWPGLATTGGLILAVLFGLWLGWPGLFARLVIVPVRDEWRRWYYRRRWLAVMTITGLAPLYRGRVLIPVIAAVAAGGPVDRVTVKLVSGQSPADFADRAEGLAHGFGVHLCRVRPAAPGLIVLELVRRDALAAPVPALPIAERVDLAGLAIGRCEDGSPWLLRLLGSHVLVAGATGAGKGSVIWSLVRALLPVILGGWVRVWACDPKRMELSFGRDLFARYADQAAAMVELLEAAVTEMHKRAGEFGPDPDVHGVGRVPVPGRGDR
jgi:S-DNA-T family DNA segregation ATPase FtsK/SpoIIIE